MTPPVAAVSLDDVTLQPEIRWALDRYREAAATATDRSSSGWALLGSTRALVALDRADEARSILGELCHHPDPEVSLQATLQSARLANDHEEWSRALDLLRDADASSLGAGWDTSLVQTRVAALVGAGRMDDARAQWEALEARWPGDEEATLPAWLGMAQLAVATGDRDTAVQLARKARAEATDPAYQDQADTLLTALGL